MLLCCALVDRFTHMNFIRVAARFHTRIYYAKKTIAQISMHFIAKCAMHTDLEKGLLMLLLWLHALALLAEPVRTVRLY